jgi:hypothetical protein
MRIVISTEGRNLSQIPRITLGMTGLACHLATWREQIPVLLAAVVTYSFLLQKEARTR